MAPVKQQGDFGRLVGVARVAIGDAPRSPEGTGEASAQPAESSLRAEIADCGRFTAIAAAWKPRRAGRRA